MSRKVEELNWFKNDSFPKYVGAIGAGVKRGNILMMVKMSSIVDELGHHTFGNHSHRRTVNSIQGLLGEGKGEEKLNKTTLRGIQSAGFCFLASLDFKEPSWTSASIPWDLGSVAKEAVAFLWTKR